MSLGYSGFDRGDRYDDDAYLERVSATNAETAALRQTLPELQQRPRLNMWGRLVETGHVTQTDGDLFAVKGDRSVYRKVTLRVADDSPIFRRVVEQAKNLLKVYAQDSLSDEDFDTIRAIEARIVTFARPVGTCKQEIIDFARSMSNSKVEACVAERTHKDV